MTTTRIFELRKDDNDRDEWHQVATLEEPGSVEIVLSNWFDEVHPPAGTYHAENDKGERFGTLYTAGAGVGRMSKSQYVCSECGKDGIYQNVTVSGWRDIEIEERNGRPEVSSTGSVETDSFMADEENYECSHCHASFARLSEAVVPAERRYECLDCNLWAFYRGADPACLDCGSRDLRLVGMPKSVLRAQEALAA